MAGTEKLSRKQIEDRLGELKNWELVGDRLHAEFKFPDFIEAFGFISSAALEAEKLNHHPDWTNSYNKVSVDLTTHDVGGVTELDFELAAKMESLAEKCLK